MKFKKLLLLTIFFAPAILIGMEESQLESWKQEHFETSEKIEPSLLSTLLPFTTKKEAAPLDLFRN